MPLAPHPVPPPDPGAGPTLLRDDQRVVPLGRSLADGHLVVLLTPVVAPLQHGPDGSSDPFEPLGRAIEARHPWIHHVPYNRAADIRRSHAAFIERARVVVFVVSGPRGRGEPDQWGLAEAALGLCEGKVQIVLACYDVRAGDPRAEPFPTVVRVAGYLPAQLHAVGALLFGENARGPSAPTRLPPVQPPPPKITWAVEPWTQPDTPAVHNLWLSCLPPRFHLEQWDLASLLTRDGYAMHHVVRDPASRTVLGFSASYLTFADGVGERLLGSVAVILVREGHRGRGIGTALHSQAVQKLRSVRGVGEVQLGSVFPRLLRGVLTEMRGEEVAWFERRGWDVRGGEVVGDWVVELDGFTPGLARADIIFKSCGPAEFDAVLALVEREATAGRAPGYFDQYARLKGTFEAQDVIVGVNGASIVACALVYVPRSGAPVAEDLPWAGKVGEGTGGVTCVCVAGEFLVRGFGSMS